MLCYLYTINLLVNFYALEKLQIKRTGILIKKSLLKEKRIWNCNCNHTKDKDNGVLLLVESWWLDWSYIWSGLREVKRGCCGGGKFNGEVDCTVASNLCDDRDEYLFWDKVHATQAAYRWSVLTLFNATTKNAEPINLAQLMQEPLCTASAPYSSSI